MWRRFLVSLFVWFSFSGIAQQASLSVTDSYFSSSFPMATSAAGYFILTNDSDEPLTLTNITVNSTIANHASLHETVLADDMVSMRPLEAISVEPGQTVQFQAGGKHIMLSGLKQPLTTQMVVDVTFTFANRNSVIQKFEVRPVTEGTAASHHNHH